MKGNANLVLHTLCAIAITGKAPKLPYIAQIFKLSIEALTPANLGQLAQDLANIKSGLHLHYNGGIDMGVPAKVDL
jgi:hypothetical protein